VSSFNATIRNILKILNVTEHPLVLKTFTDQGEQFAPQLKIGEPESSHETATINLLQFYAIHAIKWRTKLLISGLKNV
jgi:hypothetical protein